jgi:hypothetical protein
MMRAVLVLCAGLVGFAVDADAGCDISAKVAELGPGFSPVDYGNCAPGIACNFREPREFVAKAPAAALRGETAVIAAAYNAAPAFFQDALCRLDHIYVDTDTKDTQKPSVWGMRERLNVDPATGKPRTHIGISRQVLASLAKQARPYSSYENRVARMLLSGAPANLIAYAAAPDPGGKQPAALAVLAILAHEMGHIVWWEDDIGSGPFPEFSWTTKSVQHGFHNFGVEDPENPPKRRPVRADVQYALRYLPAGRAAADLRQVYGGEWASLFATVAADEDFVETYKLVVMTDTAPGAAPGRLALTRLAVSIPHSGAGDILASVKDPKTRLHDKVEWVRAKVAGR